MLKRGWRRFCIEKRNRHRLFSFYEQLTIWEQRSVSYLLRLCKIGWCMSIYNHCSPDALDALSLPLHHRYPNLKLRIFRIRVQVYFNIGGIGVPVPGWTDWCPTRRKSPRWLRAQYILPGSWLAAKRILRCSTARDRCRCRY